MTTHFTYTKEEIQDAVIMETSYIAERQANMTTPQFADGSANLYEVLHILDEHYQDLYERYLQEATAEIVLLIPTRNLAKYPDTIPEETVIISVTFEDYPGHLLTALRIKIKQYIIEYILWQWFRTKLSSIANVFYEALEGTKEEIKKLLSRRIRPFRRIPNFP